MENNSEIYLIKDVVCLLFYKLNGQMEGGDVTFCKEGNFTRLKGKVHKGTTTTFTSFLIFSRAIIYVYDQTKIYLRKWLIDDQSGEIKI